MQHWIHHPGAPEEEVGPFETYPEASFDTVMSVNVKGTFFCCQVVGGAMAEAGRGSIINVCSTYGILSPCQDIYEFRRQRGETFYKPGGVLDFQVSLAESNTLSGDILGEEGSTGEYPYSGRHL